MKIISFILFAFVSQMCIAQCDDTRLFAEKQKESFVKIYLKLKLVKPSIEDAKLFELAEKYDIAPAQFREFQDNSQINRQLTSGEEAFISELKGLKRDYQLQLESTEKQLCEIESLSYSDYQAIQHQYKSCMKFQRSLSSYFKKSMK